MRSEELDLKEGSQKGRLTNNYETSTDQTLSQASIKKNQILNSVAALNVMCNQLGDN